MQQDRMKPVEFDPVVPTRLITIHMTPRPTSGSGGRTALASRKKAPIRPSHDRHWIYDTDQQPI
jgi:hypothetical protein